jgi:phosphoribosylamine--glycine ligase
MKVLVLGEDGRAHAFVWKLFNSPQTETMLCAPGNGGTSQLVPTIELQPQQPTEIAHHSFAEQVDVIVPTSSDPLHAGLVDEAITLQLGVFGPPQRSAQIGQSRCYAKEFLLRHSLPTPRGQAFYKLATAEKYLAAQPLPVIIKADDPALPVGTYSERYAALMALREIFATPPVEGRTVGVVIEEYLPGVRVSFSAFTDGHHALPLLPTRVYDYFRENDELSFAPHLGAHTGVSAYARKLSGYLHQHLILPIVAALEQASLPYRGIVGIDCVITQRGPRITAVRCSLSDMEAQVVLPRLEDDLMTIINATIARRLEQVPPLHWRNEASVGIALVANGYPHHFPVGNPIEGLTSIDPGVFVFHDQTQNPFGLQYQPDLHRGPDPLAKLIMGMEGPGNVITTTGGHVLTVVALGADLQQARAHALANVQRITFAGSCFKEDIALREFS